MIHKNPFFFIFCAICFVSPVFVSSFQKEMTFNITRITYSPDGKSVAACGSVKLIPTIKVWDAVTSRYLAVLELPETEAISDIVFSHDGRILVSSGRDKLIRLWDTQTWKQRSALKSSPAPIRCLALSPDSKTLASGDAGVSGAVRIWDLAGEKQKLSLPGHAFGVDCVAFSPNGQLLASVASRGPVNIWDIVAKKRWSFEPHGDRESEEDNVGVFDIKFSPDNSTLAVAEHHQSMISLYDVTSRKEKPPLLGHKQPVLSLAFSPDGKILASVSANTPLSGHDPLKSAVVKFWDLDGGKELANIEFESALRCLTFSPNGKTLTVAGDEVKNISVSETLRKK